MDRNIYPGDNPWRECIGDARGHMEETEEKETLASLARLLLGARSLRARMNS
ncbi:hypothetical protein [Candidatus Binatus soli]|uniref:hypothetical protein n=1 Tax=Candidatus Binatus soli TaxID=1953413 RepID=UPI003D10DCEF